MSHSIQQRRLALFAFFFFPGLAMASWVTRTPAIRDALAVNIAEMGLVLFGLSVGSMSGILISGVLVGRYGTRPVALTGLWLVVAAMTTLALGVVLASPFVVALGLGFFGFGMGISEVAINVDGADVERITGKPVLHALHGCFSLGTACGALIGIGLTAVAFPVQWHVAAVALVGLPLIPYFIRYIPHGLGKSARLKNASLEEAAGEGRRRRASLFQDPRLMLIGIIVLAMALAEGAANDWLPILMVDEYGYSPSSGSLIFLGFAASMTVGRFGGGMLLQRYGRAAVIRASAIVGALGLALVIFAGDRIVAGFAVLLWGLGASLGFPVALSAAADSGPNPAAQVKAVAMVGYVAFLVGPPFLGLIGEHFGLRNAMLCVLAPVLIAALLAPAIDQRKAAFSR